MYKNRLKELRERNADTLNEIGNLINVDKRVYHHFETEYTIIPIKHLNVICNFFNVSLDYIFELSNVENYVRSRDDIDIILCCKRLKEFRKENKLTQQKLANFLNTVQPMIVKYENGKNIISTQFLYAICKKYNISADYLLGKTDSPKYFK